MLSNRAGRVLNSCIAFAQSALPVHCVLCAARTAQSRLCRACSAALPRLPEPRCSTCALPLANEGTCGACMRRPPRYDRVRAAFAYTFPVDALIQAYKYGGDLTLAALLSRELAPHVPCDVDAIVPMPLSASRLTERGFNQAQEIARRIGRTRRIAVLSHACRKVIDTAPQASLPFGERARNVRGAFVCDADLTGKRIAVVDDVMTTGATLDELARNLKRAGACRVEGWVIARTLR
jgi:ComF family protein